MTRPRRQVRWPRGAAALTLAALVLVGVSAGARADRRALAVPAGAPPPDDYVCAAPRAVVETNGRCDGDTPGDCRWRLPAPERVGLLYTLWRNTDPRALWGRPGLVGVVLGAAAGYARLYPGEAVVVGDLDAPGPRHTFHRDGTDADLYLPGVMREDNAGGGRYPANYAGKPDLAVRALRTRVEDLARLLASCAGGALRILYNDPPVRARFLRWYADRGLAGALGAPMTRHNRLHRFHFHVSVAPGVPPPPSVVPRDAFSAWPDTPKRRASSATTSRHPSSR